MGRLLLLVFCMVVMFTSGAYAVLDVCLDTGAPISGSTILVDADALAATGTEYVRINFVLGSWSSPTDTTLYNGMTWMQCYDSIINSLTSRGLKVYGLIGHEAVKNAGGYNADQFVNTYTANFVAIVDHFKDRVRIFESFNEPNDWAGGSSSQVEPYWFAKMLQQIYLEVKINNGHISDPAWQVTLVSGPLFGHDLSNNYADTAAPYLDQVYSAGINQLSWTWMKNTYGTYPLDGVGYHTYVRQGSNTEQAVIDRLNYNVDSIWGIVSNYEGSSSPKRIWISECGWNTNNISESEQARNVTVAFNTFNSHSKVEFGTWFQICDFGTTDKWGLFRTKPYTDTNKKPSWTSFYNWATSNNGNGTVSGIVRDTFNIAVSGATVSTTSGGYSATTDANGNYTLANVAPATYSVVASKTGYNSQTLTGKTVTAGATTTANFNIQSTTGMNPNTPTGTNKALTATSVQVDSYYSAAQDGPYAKDGSLSTKWCTTNTSSTHWIAYDLGASYTCNGFIVRHAGAGGEPTYMNTELFKLQSGTSMSGPWTDEVSVYNMTQANVTTCSFITPKSLRYVRLYITDSGIDNHARIPEFEVWCNTSAGTIAGNVKDQAGLNVSGATVSTTSGGYTTTTNSSGNYTLSNVATGTYSVVASKTGYNSQTQTGKTVNAGATTTCNFTITRQTGIIVGNVKDSSSVNLSGATVSTTTGGYTTTTNSSGNYTLSNVATGTYSVVASKTGYNPSTQTGKTVNYNQTTTVNFTLTPTSSTIASENFDTLPSWTSYFDATWGSAASWSSVSGGQAGNCMQASRSSQGSSSKVKVYTVPQNTTITVSCYMKCPSYANSYWVECACRLGSYTASNFDSDSANWTYIKKFSNSGTNGNGNTWTNYSVQVNTGSNTQISIGYKHGASGCTGPTAYWDTFLIQ